MLSTPLGFILSLIAVVTNKDRRAGMWGLILTGAIIAFFLTTALCR